MLRRTSATNTGNSVAAWTKSTHLRRPIQSTFAYQSSSLSAARAASARGPANSSMARDVHLRTMGET